MSDGADDDTDTSLDQRAMDQARRLTARTVFGIDQSTVPSDDFVPGF